MNLRSFSTLQLALGASIAVHAVLLTVRFVDPESFNRVFEDTPLEVILVNAKSQRQARQGQGHCPDHRWPVVARPKKAAPPARCHRRR